VPHLFDENGYLKFRNPQAASGLWVLGGSRAAVFVRSDVKPADKWQAVEMLRKKVEGVTTS
jgi:hypothetical protein